jgi:hypothetical protein
MDNVEKSLIVIGITRYRATLLCISAAEQDERLMACVYERPQRV